MVNGIRGLKLCGRCVRLVDKDTGTTDQGEFLGDVIRWDDGDEWRR
eukprot:CAMPEP_0195074650 /NCGR_PEP_ID=MMETSP0448-20130528/17707_1 /TAXON_ID=66468 /ORGANISM="Heterocapsa triquestra, Strain CCMP 448" /LENGTH=45 /DNA_ID= /DNA_START= /DNA_END= /DNA_ORIENTATION=